MRANYQNCLEDCSAFVQYKTQSRSWLLARAVRSTTSCLGWPKNVRGCQ